MPWRGSSFELSSFDIDRLGHILAGEGDWFSADLLRLIAKADPQNRAALRTIYPQHVEAFEKWSRTPARKEYQ